MYLFAILSWLVSLLFFVSGFFVFHRKQSIAGAIVLSYLALLTAIRPLMLLLKLDTPIPDSHWDECWAELSLASMAVCLWISMILFSRLALGPASIAMAVFLPKAPKHVSHELMVIITFIVTGIAVTANLYMVSQYGSVARFMFAVKIEKAIGSAYLIRQMAMLGAIVASFGMFSAARSSPKKNSRVSKSIPKPMLAFYVSMIMINLGCNYLWGNRKNIALFFVAAAFAYHFYIRRLKIHEVVAGIFILASALQGLRLLRESFTSEVVGRNIGLYAEHGPIRYTSSSLHLADYDALMLALRDGGELYEFRGGEHFFNGLATLVPRLFWPEKPSGYHVGRWFRQNYEPEKQNGWPVTPIGSWYVNFGITGIIVGGLLTGILIGAIDYRYDKPGEYAWHAFMAPILAAFLMDGGWNTGLPQYVLHYLIPMFFLAVALNLMNSSGRRIPS